MATIQVDPQEAVFYDPDGANAPLTLQFPLSTEWPEGTRIRMHNKTNSPTLVTFLCQGSDLLADPEANDTYVNTATYRVGLGVIEYMKVGTQWRISQYSNPQLAIKSTDTFVYAAYGGLRLTVPPVAFPNLDGTYQKITQFDDISILVPRGVVQNLANSSLEFEAVGVYVLMVNLTIGHNEAQGSRTIFLQLYNETDGIVGGTFPIGIGRNVEVTGITLPILTEVGSAAIGDQFILQIGGGDGVTTVTLETLEFKAFSVGEYRGIL